MCLKQSWAGSSGRGRQYGSVLQQGGMGCFKHELPWVDNILVYLAASILLSEQQHLVVEHTLQCYPCEDTARATEEYGSASQPYAFHPQCMRLDRSVAHLWWLNWASTDNKKKWKQALQMLWEYTCKYPYCLLSLQLLARLRYQMWDNMLHFHLFLAVLTKPKGNWFHASTTQLFW